MTSNRAAIALNPKRWGKHWGLRRLADEQGFFSMVAIDQRPPIVNLVAKARGIDAAHVSFEDIVRCKALLAQGLAPHASAMLVDPNYGLPAASPWLQPARGLLLTLEDHRFDDHPEGRLSHLIKDWSVAQIRRTGADAVKLLAWYRPDASAAVLAHQQALVRKVGQACLAHDIAFVFELLVHPFAARAGQAASYEEDAGKQAQLVIQSVRTFADPSYGVDLFKLESPLPMASMPAPGSEGADAAQDAFDQMAAACAGVPWVLLSAGGSASSFRHALHYACKAGASGFLAGRAVWWDALKAFPDEEAVLQALQHDSVPYLETLRERVRSTGRALQTRVDFAQITAEGEVCEQRAPSE